LIYFSKKTILILLFLKCKKLNCISVESQSILTSAEDPKNEISSTFRQLSSENLNRKKMNASLNDSIYKESLVESVENEQNESEISVSEISSVYLQNTNQVYKKKIRLKIEGKKKLLFLKKFRFINSSYNPH
jgi:hypothetical protein